MKAAISTNSENTGLRGKLKESSEWEKPLQGKKGTHVSVLLYGVPPSTNERKQVRQVVSHGS